MNTVPVTIVDVPRYVVAVVEVEVYVSSHAHDAGHVLVNGVNGKGTRALYSASQQTEQLDEHTPSGAAGGP